jgi:hypothetical protein
VEVPMGHVGGQVNLSTGGHLDVPADGQSGR